MPTRLLLDGDDLPELMLRIRDEMGPQARVVKAERIRSGGFAGFFARERYELTVEVPDPPSARDRWVAARSGGGLEALVAAADAGDDAVESADVEAAAPAEPPVSTASESFAEVLASVRAMVGQGETAGVAVSPGPGAIAGGPTGPGPASPAPPSSAMSTSPGEPAPGRALGDGPASPAPPSSAMSTSPGEPAPARASAEPVAFAFPRIERPEPAASTAAVPEPPTPVAEPAPAEPTAGERSTAATAADLLELGVPVRLLEGFASLTDPVPLSILVRRFERPPAVRLEPGVTVAVVGPGADALRTAGQMAGRAGLDPRDVLLAGDIDAVAGHGRRLLTVAAAARHRSRRRTDAPTVVALGVGDGPAAWTEAAELLDALSPEQAWGVLDARLRAAEMRRFVRGVGALRPLDALAVVGTAQAQAPGVVLDVGTPVGWVDGLPATALVWAALLSERITDDADWD